MRDFSFILILTKGRGRVAFKIISRLSLKSSRARVSNLKKKSNERLTKKQNYLFFFQL